MLAPLPVQNRQPEDNDTNKQTKPAVGTDTEQLPDKDNDAVESMPVTPVIDRHCSGYICPGDDTSVKGACSCNGQFLDGSALTDTFYRKSCYLGLGTWPPTDHAACATTSRTFIGNLVLSDLDSSSLSSPDVQTGFTQVAPGEGSSSGRRRPARKSSGTSSSPIGHVQGKASGSKSDKRPLGIGGDGDEDEDSGNKSKGKETSSNNILRRFACPFQKRDPVYYSYNGTTGRYRACSGLGFTDITRLK